MDSEEDIPEIDLKITSYSSLEEMWKEQAEQQRQLDERMGYFELDKWRTHHMVPVTKEGRPSRSGFIVLDVLQFLWDRPYDTITLAYIWALQPTSIRVTTGMETLDARTGRITVTVGEKDVVKRIKQEVEVALPDGVSHGSALQDALRYGLNSKQVKWHEDAKGYVYAPYQMFKQDDEGNLIEYPKDDEETS